MAVIVPVMPPHPPCDPHVRLTALVPIFTEALIRGFVNFGQGVLVGGAVVGFSVGLGVDVGVGANVFAGGTNVGLSVGLGVSVGAGANVLVGGAKVGRSVGLEVRVGAVVEVGSGVSVGKAKGFCVTVGIGVGAGAPQATAKTDTTMRNPKSVVGFLIVVSFS